MSSKMPFALHAERGFTVRFPSRQPIGITWYEQSVSPLPTWEEAPPTILFSHPLSGGRATSLSLRLLVCGHAYDREQRIEGGNLASLLRLQDALDKASSPRAVFSRLDGNFLLCYVPPDLSCCWLYRSVTGTRGLYYRQDATGCSWSTSIDTLFAPRSASLADIDLDLLPALVTALPLPPQMTGYRHIRCLPAGHGMQYYPDSHCSWFVEDFRLPHNDQQQIAFDEAAQRLRWHVSQAVQRALPGTAPLGVLLSGGLDSSVIALEAARIAGPEQIYGLHWTWRTLPNFRDEDTCADQVARWLGIRLLPVECSPFIAAGGDHVRSMQPLALPFNHAFFRCFQASAQLAAQQHMSTLLSGHLGDVLLQGAWNDGFRARLRRLSPRTLLSTFAQLLSWYPRGQALRIGFDFLRTYDRPKATALPARITRCQQWLTSSAWATVAAQEKYTYPCRSTTLSTAITYQAIKQEIDTNTPLDTDILEHALHPCGMTLQHPYADRSLLEFCLGLGPEHRAGFVAGTRLSKVLLRFAYRAALPASIIAREVRLPYAAIEREYCFRNQAELLALFGADSCLAHCGVIDPHRMHAILSDSLALQHHYDALVPAAGVELWLRRANGQSLPAPPQAPSPSIYPFERPTPSQQQGVIDFPAQVIARDINGLLVLVHRTTQEVLQLSHTASHWLRILQATPSWEESERRWQACILEGKEDWQTMYTLLNDLAREGWVTLHKP